MIKQIKLYGLLLTLVFVFLSCAEKEIETPALQGPYLGQTPPGWAKPSTQQAERTADPLPLREIPFLHQPAEQKDSRRLFQDIRGHCKGLDRAPEWLWGHILGGYVGY
ncbi:hypothetical protein ACFLT2_14220 [Acidobacteriota bacterium]